MAVAPDGSWLACATDGVDDCDPLFGHDRRTSNDGDAGTVRVWNPVTGAEVAALTGHASGVTALAVAPDGSWLASSSLDGTVRLWNPVTGTELAELTERVAGVTALAVAPDGSRLAAVGADGTVVRLWNPATGAEVAALTGHAAVVNALAFAPDATWLASASEDGAVRLWDLATAGTGPSSPAGGVDVLAVSPDGSWIASAANQPRFGRDDDSVRLWDPVSGRQRVDRLAGTASVNLLAAAPDGSWLATASASDLRAWPQFDDGDSTVRLWDPATGAELALLTGHEAPVSALAAAPDGTWLASASLDGTVRLWDPATGVELAVLAGHPGGATALPPAPDGSWLAAANGYYDSGFVGGDGSIRVWDPNTGVKIAVLKGHYDKVSVLAAAPDGSWLASAGDLDDGTPDRPDDGTIRLWNRAAGTERAALSGHDGGVSRLVLAPDGSWLASAGKDGTVRLWDPAAGAALAVLTGHVGRVSGLAVASDGSWLASAGRDGTVRLWDPSTGAETSAVRFDSPLNCLERSDSHSGLVAGGDRGTYFLTRRRRSPQA